MQKKIIIKIGDRQFWKSFGLKKRSDVMEEEMRSAHTGEIVIGKRKILNIYICKRCDFVSKTRIRI